MFVDLAADFVGEDRTVAVGAADSTAVVVLAVGSIAVAVVVLAVGSIAVEVAAEAEATPAEAAA